MLGWHINDELKRIMERCWRGLLYYYYYYYYYIIYLE
jgi:hypothetical protein